MSDLLTRLRNYLIVILAGDRTVVINAMIRSGAIELRRPGFFYRNTLEGEVVISDVSNTETTDANR